MEGTFNLDTMDFVICGYLFGGIKADAVSWPLRRPLDHFRCLGRLFDVCKAKVNYVGVGESSSKCLSESARLLHSSHHRNQNSTSSSKSSAMNDVELGDESRSRVTRTAFKTSFAAASIAFAMGLLPSAP